MKKYLACLLVGALAFTGCKKLKNLLNFNISYPDTFSVPSDPLAGIPLTFQTGNMATNSSTEFQTYNTASSLVKHVYLTQLSLSILSPQGQNFSFLRSTKIFLYSPGLGSTEVAYLDSIPSNVGNQLLLKMTGTDIQNYIKLDSFALQTTVVTSQTTSQDITLSCNSQFQVIASPF
ncbi:MAG TPA: hypothetical protein VNE41_12380 [Chitinophagaceae bacterium]|nr:hypothetical protein [Chitinophagaceae bacterium]